MEHVIKLASKLCKTHQCERNLSERALSRDSNLDWPAAEPKICNLVV